MLLDAALAAGAERPARRRRDAACCATRTGAVIGVHRRDRGAGATFAARAGITIGADGLRSTVADAVERRRRARGRGASAVLYGYWSASTCDGYEWFYRPGVAPA